MKKGNKKKRKREREREKKKKELHPNLSQSTFMISLRRNHKSVERKKRRGKKK